MRALYRAGAGALALALLCNAHAQTGPSTAAAASASVPEPAAAPQGEPATSAAAGRHPGFEGAVGLALEYKPAYSGSSDMRVRPALAGFARWGRISVTGAGSFTTREQDDVEAGVDAELLRRDQLRLSASLRIDQGRRESSSPRLTGMGNIAPTLRTRLGLRWNFTPQWQGTLAGSTDALGHGGGLTINAGLSRSIRINPGQRLIFGAGLGWGSARYMQTWYGIAPVQAVASGYPVYQPGAGLRDVSVYATWRTEIDRHWAGFATLAQSRLTGPAAASPLTLRRDTDSLSLGLVRRF
jgi:MipA family protein